MELEYKGYRATITIEATDFSDICFGLQHNIVLKVRAPHLRCTQATMTNEEYDALEAIAQNLFIRSVDSKTKPKRKRKIS